MECSEPLEIKVKNKQKRKVILNKKEDDKVNMQVNFSETKL